MNNKVIKTLEFNKILEMLTQHADSESGKALCSELRPSTDIVSIEKMQSETESALRRIRFFGKLSFNGIKDIKGSLKRLEIGSSLGIPELLAINTVLTVSAKAKSYNRKYEENEESKEENKAFDALSGYFINIESLSPVKKEIDRVIISSTEIADNASPELLSIRKKKKTVNGRIHSELNKILNSSRQKLQDAVITMRDGRYCLPVKPEYKSSFPGMVHDQSASGSTLFIEPLKIISLNNTVREYEAEEKKEIEKILETLSYSLIPYIDEIRNNVSILTQLDFIFAKASLALSMDASRPLLNNEHYINLKDARHPLIDKNKVVPINVYIGKDFHMLIITGPNTGGKTVCLKTVGLFQLMAQSGLFVPAFQGSELSVFNEIFADIGDEQSIEQSLSTFSSHMKNTVDILKEADSFSLCLFDELGAGTDPTEGAALAISILDFLRKMNVRCIATTHYSELKLYALSTEGTKNASCEFDVKTLRPTYRLLIGIPGKSNAFAISGKLGLPDFIIDDAKNRIEQEDIHFEDVIASLEESRLTIEKDKKQIASYKSDIEKYKQRTRMQSENIDKDKEKILEAARKEARKILEEAKETADLVINEIKAQRKEGAHTIEMEQTRSVLKNSLGKTTKVVNVSPKPSGKKLDPKKIRIGDKVRVLSMDMEAEVTALPDKKNMLYVTAGIIRTKVNIKDLEFISKSTILKEDKKKTGAGTIRMSKSASISPEVNIIGMTRDEAKPVLTKYLDDAYLAHLDMVRIVHGRGTGVLKKMVHSVLKNLKYVKSYRLGEFGEGGDGVTIAKFK